MLCVLRAHTGNALKPLAVATVLSKLIGVTLFISRTVFNETQHRWSDGCAISIIRSIFTFSAAALCQVMKCVFKSLRSVMVSGIANGNLKGKSEFTTTWTMQQPAKQSAIVKHLVGGRRSD
jgi:hypothetical protein